ncbi:MAG TPA: hypothetical protein GX707_11545 [Epulopiscium sp.]|nr:hypothetical protein [Candidatus Epulonipiscium sp.]
MDNKATIKIDEQLKKIKNSPVPAGPIAKYLTNKCKADKSFTDRVMLEDKSLKECFMYVYSEVKKKLNGVSGYLADEEVYKMAEDYFTLDKVEIDKAIKEPKKSKQVKKNEKTKTKKTEPKPKAKKSPKKEKITTLENADQVTLFEL